MSIKTPKQTNKTILVTSSFFVVVLLLLGLGAFDVIEAASLILTPIGAGVLTIFAAVILLLETYFEGKKPDLKKDRGALINTILSSILVIFGVILMVGKPEVTGVWLGVLGISWIISSVFLTIEIIWD